MRILIQRLEVVQHHELIRYTINGAIATFVHFSALQINLNILAMTSAGRANFIAALFGIFTSFIGSRYFVFKTKQMPILRQVFKFSGLYLIIATLHGFLLFGWTDILAWDYKVGFVLATAMQIFISYWGNKFLVFRI